MTPKLEPPTLDVKEELGEPEANEQNPDALRKGSGKSWSLRTSEIRKIPG